MPGTVLERYLEEWALEVLAIFRAHAIRVARLDSRSRLVRGFDYQVSRAEVAIFAKDYIKYVEGGRGKGKAKVPIDVLKEWARRYRVRPRPGQTELSMLYAIQNAIFLNGIAPRPFTPGAIEESFDALDPYMNIWLGAQVEVFAEAFRKTQV